MIEVGTTLKHTDGDWTATVRDIDPQYNQLQVDITSANGHHHPEEWNLAHTLAGLKQRVYQICNDEH